MTETETPAMPLMREALYELVWSEPMLKAAARYDVSSSYMARVCTLMNVPRPERGYWAKLAAGQKLPVPPLPPARAGDELAWSKGSQSAPVARPLPRPPSGTPRRRRRAQAERQSRHPLVDGAKALFEKGRYTHETGYLKPDKKLLVDLVVTKTGLDKALTFAEQLFASLEAFGYRVMIASSGERLRRAAVDEHEVPRKRRGSGYDQGYEYNSLWSPYRCTVVYIGTVAIGLTIIEMAEEVEVRYVNGKYIREADYVPPKRRRYEYEHTWTTKKGFPTGRLCLQAYSPYYRADWIKRWQETKTQELNGQIKTIVKELEEAAGEIARLVEEGERQAAIERQRWEAQRECERQEEAVRRAAQARKESREELLQIIERWGTATRIEQFFREAEQRAAGLGDEERARLLERLRRAREMVGSVDALDRFLAWRVPEER